MLISVVIPTRNRPSDLRRALQGVSNQTHAEFEVLVVDDGSDETTRQSYPALWGKLDARFKLITMGAPGQRGVGPSVTRNWAVEQSQGEVIAFCDDDDFWCDPSHLSTLAHVFETQADVDMYIGNQRAVTTGGQVKSDWLPTLSLLVKRRTANPDGTYRLSLKDLTQAGGFAQLNILVLRKRVFAEIGGFWTRTRYEEDRDLYWRAADASRAIVYNPRVIAQHNVPDAAKRTNLSTAYTWADRWLISILVCQHVMATVRSPEISGQNLEYEGDLLRKLASHFLTTGDYYKAFTFGVQALGSRFSFKWAAYMLWNWLRMALRGIAS